MKTILFIGGTGAQGAAVVRHLIAAGGYRVLLFTRDASSSQCKDLIALGNVEAVLNPAAQGYDLDAFEAAARCADGVFLNTDGFSTGEVAETYWGIRLYEICLKAGTRHVVYSGLDDNYRESGYDSDYYVAHFQGKARVQTFIRAQPTSKTIWTITRTGPYIEMLSESLRPHLDENGTYHFTYPLDEGAIVLLHLDDYARYVHWIFENPTQSSGLDLGVAIAHITGQDLATAFTAVTGKPAVYDNISADAWCDKAFSRLPNGSDTKLGFRSVQDQSALTLTYKENFTNFFNLFKASKDNVGLIRRDYNLLDRILPDRVSSAREWMEKTKYTGEPREGSILKTAVRAVE